MDIGSTAEAYASAIFEGYKADACTVNAYLGIDGIKPFLNFEDKGIFVLVKTSNPSSGDFQDLFSVKLEDVPNGQTEVEKKSIALVRNYVQMARLVQKWSKELNSSSDFHNLGVVVGAHRHMDMPGDARRKIGSDASHA